MCGRYVIEPDDEEHFFEHFGADLSDELFPRGIVSYNIAPTQAQPVIRASESGQEASPMHWGLIPGWSDDRAIASKLINARSETVHQKPSFRNAYKSRRCLVPASGWYEWQQPSKKPFYFRREDREALVFGGIWEEWTDRHSGELVETYSILTHDAGPSIGTFHHRQPLVINAVEREQWLAPSYKPQMLAGFVEASAQVGFTGLEVSKDVGKVSNNRPELIAPLRKEGLFD